jgi:hypothetical protein
MTRTTIQIFKQNQWFAFTALIKELLMAVAALICHLDSAKVAERLKMNNMLCRVVRMAT